jgi:hypothetical protein
VDGGNCPASDSIRKHGTAKRVSLAGGWAIIMRMPQLPVDVVAPGQSIDFALNASRNTGFYTGVNQAFTVSRAGQVLVFGALLGQRGAALLPDFGAVGIGVSDAGILCADNVGCQRYGHQILVSAGGQQAVIARGTTGRVDAYAVTVDEVMDTFDFGSCDQNSHTLIGGVRVP